MDPLRGYISRVRQFGPNARWYLVYTFLSGLGYGVFGLLYNLYILALGEDRAFLGILVALPLVIATALAIPAGMLGRRIGYRQTLLMGVMAQVLSLLGVAFVHDSVGLLLFAFGFGLSQGLIDVSNAPFVAENSGLSERTHLFSIQFSVRLFAGFFGSLVAGMLPARLALLLQAGPESSTAYRAALLFGAALFLLAMIPLLRLSARPPTSYTAEDENEIPHGSRGFSALAKLFLPQIIIGAGAGALVPFLNVFFKSRFGVSDALLGGLFAAQSVAMGLATLLGPAFAARFGRVRTVVLTQLVSIPFLILLGFTPVLGFAATGFLARAGLMNMGHPLYSAFAMEQVDVRRRATASALLVMSSQGSRAVGSWLSGLLQQETGFRYVFVLTISCYLLASFLVFRFFVRGARPTPGSPT